MRVDELMTRNVMTCRPGDPLSVAADIMWRHDCGAVPVVDGKRRVLGMLTDRDICMATWMEGAPAHELPATLPMSRVVWSCRNTHSLAEVVAILRKHRVRRLPVLDAEDRLVGIVTVNDIARLAGRKGKGRKAGVTDAQLRKTVAALGEPRGL
ncbi:MAG: CBS domain-containing protein [bacterium]|nr:CBS domain-containing protein [bacterium]